MFFILLGFQVAHLRQMFAGIQFIY